MSIFATYFHFLKCKSCMCTCVFCCCKWNCLGKNPHCLAIGRILFTCMKFNMSNYNMHFSCTWKDVLIKGLTIFWPTYFGRFYFGQRKPIWRSLHVGVPSEGLLKPFKPLGLKMTKKWMRLLWKLNVCSPVYPPLQLCTFNIGLSSYITNLAYDKLINHVKFVHS